LKKYPECINCYDQATKINPNFTNAWHNKGLAYYYSGMYELAIKCYDTALEIDPQYAKAHANRKSAMDKLNKK